MSLPTQRQESTSGPSPLQTSKLLIADHPYQFLPNLAAIYGDSCAVILQQLHWTIQRPWFEGERLLVQTFDDLTYIRLFPFMWFDTLEGITKHLAKSTFYRYRKSLEECGALSVLSTLGDKNPNSSRRNDEAAWYAIDHVVVQRHEAAYSTAFEEALARRAAQRAQVQFHDKDAHWRPSKDEDVSKQLDAWRACLNQIESDQSTNEKATDIDVNSSHGEGHKSGDGAGALKAKNWGGKREKIGNEIVESTQSQVGTESVSIKNVGFFDTKSSQSQVGTESVSTNLVSQVESEPVSSWDSSQSQLETGPSANLRLHPYKQTLSLERTTDDTSEDFASLQMSSADADAVVESNLILSKDDNQKNVGDLKIARAAIQSQVPIQIALPEVALSPLPQPVPESLAQLAARFADVATEEYGLRCELELAARIVARSPYATMSDVAVVRMIGPDHVEAGLDKALFGEKKRALVAEMPLLRWLLFTWPAHRADVQAWATRKNRAVNLAGAFVTKWEEGTLPPRDWVAGQVNAMRAEIRAEEAAQEGRRAKEVWEGLSGPQRAAVASHGAMRAAERGGGNWNDQKEREARERRALLLDEGFMTALSSLIEAETKPATHLTSASESELELEPALNNKPEVAAPTKYVPSAAELNRMQFHAQKLLPQLRRGELDLDAAEDHAIGAWLYSPKQAALIREMVEVLMNAESKEAVA